MRIQRVLSSTRTIPHTSLLLYFLLVINENGPVFLGVEGFVSRTTFQPTRNEFCNRPFHLSSLIGSDFIPNVAFEDTESLRLKVGVAAAAAAIVLGSATQVPPANVVDKKQITLLLQGTYLGRKSSTLEKVYKATQDGWSALAFHEAVDGKGSALVVAKGNNGAVFGGYNPNGWRSTDDYYLSSQAFLWYSKGRSIVKLPTLPGGNCAVFDYATAGPTFGTSDLMIGPPQAAIMGGFAGPDTEDMSTSAGNLRQCKSAVGSVYDGDRGWPIRGSTRLTEVEVYCSAL